MSRSSPTIRLEALAAGYNPRWRYADADASVVSTATLENNAGCDMMPHYRCNYACKVFVRVVDNSAGGVRVDQSDGDQSYATVEVRTDLTSFSTGYKCAITCADIFPEARSRRDLVSILRRWAASPTLRVHVTAGVHVGSISAFLNTGELRVTGATVGTVKGAHTPLGDIPRGECMW